MTPASELPDDAENLVGRIRRHDLYRHVRDDRSLRILMRSHIFAVWDFQSLLKALQRELTCVDVPWLPTADPEARRLVNEIVLDEESDVCPWGGHLSHFEIYYRAMRECGADTGHIDSFLGALGGGRPWREALASSGASTPVQHFVRTTMEIAENRSAPSIAAAFSLGREDIIPQMFQSLVDNLAGGNPGSWSTFQFYLQRHITHDEEKHGPLARSLVARLCGADPRLKAEVISTQKRCLEARITLWDGVLREIQNQKSDFLGAG